VISKVPTHGEHHRPRGTVSPSLAGQSLPDGTFGCHCAYCNGCPADQRAQPIAQWGPELGVSRWSPHRLPIWLPLMSPPVVTSWRMVNDSCSSPLVHVLEICPEFRVSCAYPRNEARASTRPQACARNLKELELRLRSVLRIKLVDPHNGAARTASHTAWFVHARSEPPG
jgi:hypothetical protein